MVIEKSPSLKSAGSKASVIDFRARPNTHEYMDMQDPKSWPRFNYGQMPPTESLQRFVNHLDEVGVSIAVFTGRQTPMPSYTLSNDYIDDCAKAFPDRIIPIGGIDGAAKFAAVREAERVLGKLKFKGLCIDLYGYYADDRFLYPIYCKCIEYGVPIVLTMGARTTPWNDPSRVAIVARDFPELNIVCSHVVSPGADELVALAFALENVFLEFSMYHFLPGFDDLMKCANSYLQDKVLYASGFPFLPLEDIGIYNKYPFDEKARQKVMYANAARLLKLE
jgi:predicted TIM-barrel fold metal-dependent hydrolase